MPLKNRVSLIGVLLAAVLAVGNFGCGGGGSSATESRIALAYGR